MQTRISANYLDRSDKTNRVLLNVDGELTPVGDIIATNVSFVPSNDKEMDLGCTQVAVTEDPVTVVPSGEDTDVTDLTELAYYCGYIGRASNYKRVNSAQKLVIKSGKMFAVL